MEAKTSHSLNLSTWMNTEKNVMRPSSSVGFCQKFSEKKSIQILISNHWQHKKAATWHAPVQLKVSCTSQNLPASVLESGSFPASYDEDVILKNVSEEIEPHLNGRCIYLVGMMGSGKTTIGRILSEVVAYSFFDSDKLIEKAVWGTAVADIFKKHGESFFRDNETEVLRKLSTMHRLVVSTGGGAVIRSVNWKYMQKGISVWLDVPLEALARRITAIGTDSRPLLHQGSGDAYEQTFSRLNMLWKARSDSYTNASARVSLEDLAAKLGYEDVCSITPTEIAIEALLQIKNYLGK